MPDDNYIWMLLIEDMVYITKDEPHHDNYKEYNSIPKSIIPIHLIENQPVKIYLSKLKPSESYTCGWNEAIYVFGENLVFD